jgi:hypothetical protein
MQTWQAALEAFARDAGCLPSDTVSRASAPFEIGVLGLSGVGKSSLLDGLIDPVRNPIPAGGIGPLTGVPLRIHYASSAVLRVRYVDRAWWRDGIHKLQGSATRASPVELARLSLACTGDPYRLRDPIRLEAAMHYAWQPSSAPTPVEAPETLLALHRVHEILCRDGAPRAWSCDAPDAAFFRRLQDHCAGHGAALCEQVELGWPSSLLHTGLTLVDLPGLGTTGDAHARHTHAWSERASAILLVTDRAGLPDAVVSCLRRGGFFARVAEGRADLISVMTKLDHVTDDARRAQRVRVPWATTFRAVVARAESELLDQVSVAIRREAGAPRAGEANACDVLRVFGVSSAEHQRLVHRDEAGPPRLRIAESSGLPQVGRALTALYRLRSSPWACEILDRVRAARGAATLLPALISLVDMEGS